MIITPWLVVFNSVVFVLVFLFVNTIDKRKWLTILVSLVITPIIYFYAFYPFVNIFSNYHHQKYFNTEAWIEKPALRYEMSDDLLSSETLIGKSKSQITELLGKAEWLAWNNQEKSHDKNIWNYSLGIEPGAFNTNKECLQLHFKNDTVTEAKTYLEELKFDAKD